MRVARVAAVLVIALLCVTLAFGCFVAAVFESDGFGRPRDAEARPLYLAVLAAGLVVSVLAPFAVWRALLPGAAREARWLGVAAAIAVALALLGVSWG